MVVAGWWPGQMTDDTRDRPRRPDAHGVQCRVENFMKKKEIDHLWIYSGIDLPCLMQCPSHQCPPYPCMCHLDVSFSGQASHLRKPSGPGTDYFERNPPGQQGSASQVVLLLR